MDTVFIGFAEKDKIYNYEMLSLELLTASLKEQGMTSHLLQIEFELNTTLNDAYLEQFMERLDWDSVGVVGISPIYIYAEVINYVIKYIKSRHPHIKIVMGGAMIVAHLSNQIYDVFPQADILSVGEGEITFVELVKRIQAGKGLAGCAGIVYRDGSEINVEPVRDTIENLDEIPWAHRCMLVANKGTVTYLQTARGCNGSCTFCSESRIFSIKGHGKRWRGRSPKNVVDEMEEIVRTHNVRVFSFVDNSFEDPIDGGEQRVRDIADEINSRGLDVFFRTLMRAENIVKMSSETLEKLKNAGMYHVLIGIESAYPPTLKLFGKKATVQDNIESIQIIDKLHMDVVIGFIPYHPYSTFEEVLANLDFFHSSKMLFKFHEVIDNQLKLFQNTPLFDKVKRDGLLTEDFSMLNPYGYRFQNPDVQILCCASTKMMDYLYQNAQLHKYIEMTKYIKYTLFKEEKYGNIGVGIYWQTLRDIEYTVGTHIISVYEKLVHTCKALKNPDDVIDTETLQSMALHISNGIKEMGKLLKRLVQYI